MNIKSISLTQFDRRENFLRLENLFILTSRLYRSAKNIPIGARK